MEVGDNRGRPVRYFRVPFLFDNCSIFPADKIRRWLSPPDSSKNLHEADDKRQVDTCTWFLEGDRFFEWRETPGFLWVKGKGEPLHSKLFEFRVINNSIAGSGKSILW